jgi:hypothetical protein
MTKKNVKLIGSEDAEDRCQLVQQEHVKKKYSSAIANGWQRGCTLDHMKVRDSQPVRRDKKPVPRVVGVPLSSIATISTTAGFVFATISGIEAACRWEFESSTVAKMRMLRE